MKLAIIGQQAFGKAVLEAFLVRGDTVAGIFCAPEKPGGKPDPLRLAAQEHGLTLFQLPSLKGPEAASALKALDVDIAVMAYVLQFAPQSFVTIPRHGTIQYHPSLLPRYRGPSAINWPVILGETETGLTIFRPTDGLDEGPVILQKRVAIGPDDTVGGLYFDHLFPLGVEAMLEAADLVAGGQHMETPQDEGQASYEGWCRAPEARINWHAHIDALYNLIRGCTPAPGAWTMVGGEKVILTAARKHPARRFGDVLGKPGEICATSDAGIEVSVQGGRLQILKVRTAAGEKLSAAAFAAAAGLEVGSILDGAQVTAVPTRQPVPTA
jgi:methionyl-tRNA formyltransferase